MDPFVGSGAIPLESLMLGRNVVCIDTNPYAITLTRGKLKAPNEAESAFARISRAVEFLESKRTKFDVRSVPNWVRSFFHPKTLGEAIAFMNAFRTYDDAFAASCLLGILHHQRPGFLSYPSSHLIPYLRTRRFPKNRFPSLYSYRPVVPRLMEKVKRTYRRAAKLDPSLSKRIYHSDATKISIKPGSIDSIITSPPYMDALDYARDNRLRLWFLGVEDYRECDTKFGSLDKFSAFMTAFLSRSGKWLRKGGYCVLVIGDVNSRGKSIDVAKVVISIATNRIGLFRLESALTDKVPDERRARRGLLCTETESIVVLRRK